MPILVPDLKRKFDLMLAHGPYRDWGAIAVRFGREAKTLRWWCNGDASRHPGTIPGSHFGDLLEVLRESLARDIDDAELRRIALADYHVFAHAFAVGGGGLQSLQHLIATEGRRGRLTLINSEHDAALVERARPRDDLAVWRLGEPFALRLDVSVPGTLLLLQRAHHAWAFVPIDDDRCMLAVRRGGLVLPQSSAGAQGSLVEHRDAGHHRFIALISRNPLPPPLVERAHLEGQIDNSGLAVIGDFFRRLAPASRSIDVLELRFVAAR